MSGGVFSDDFDRADGDLGQNGDAWAPLPAGWEITTWRGQPTVLPGLDVTLDFPPIPHPPYPRRDARPLRGLDRLRFRWRLLALGFVGFTTFQRTMVWKYRVEVLVDGLPGPQTWAAYWELRRRLGTR